MRQARPDSPTISLAVLGASRALGFFVLAFGFPDWQVAVETAQVLAGIVDYPPDSPFYIYHLRIWTVVHHVCAVLLLAGLSEVQLSILLSSRVPDRIRGA